jgi:hypothetical protein
MGLGPWVIHGECNSCGTVSDGIAIQDDRTPSLMRAIACLELERIGWRVDRRYPDPLKIYCPDCKDF